MQKILHRCHGLTDATPRGAHASASHERAPVDNICEKQTSQSLEKQTHTQLADKNRPVGTQNRPPAYHETIPQPKLTPLQSSLRLKAEQRL